MRLGLWPANDGRAPHRVDESATCRCHSATCATRQRHARTHDPGSTQDERTKSCEAVTCVVAGRAQQCSERETRGRSSPECLEDMADRRDVPTRGLVHETRTHKRADQFNWDLLKPCVLVLHVLVRQPQERGHVAHVRFPHRSCTQGEEPPKCTRTAPSAHTWRGRHTRTASARHWRSTRAWHTAFA